MQGNTTADRPVSERTLVTAAEWFAGGRRVPYDPRSARIPDEGETSAHPGCLPTRTPTHGAAHRCCAPGWARSRCGGHSEPRKCSTWP